MQQEAGQYQLGGGYFTYKLNDSEYSEEIKDVQAWLSEMQTHGGDSEFNLTIKLPTEYTVPEEAAVELGVGWQFSILSPFYQLSMLSDTIISFTYQIGDGEIVNVDANNIVEILETFENIQLDAMLPIKFTNIKYGKVIACEGDTNVITRIGDEAFANCSNLTNISIPNSITYIGDDVFANCSNLTNISIPNSITYIGYDVFRGCNNLKYNENNNGKYLGNKENPYLVLVDVIDTSVSEFSISDSCQIIYAYAFDGCWNLTEIYYQGTIDQWLNMTFVGSWHSGNNTNLYINNELVDEITVNTDIPSYAFYEIDSITKVTLGEGATSIGDCAFEGCSALQSIELPSSLTSIGDYAFEGCSALQSIELPSSLTSIGDYAFRDCISLTEITLPNSLTSIGSDAFYYCTSLTSITIPEGVTSIGSWAFRNCTSLATVTFAQGSQLESIGDYAFSSCSNLTEITLPSSLKSIGDSAFFGCSNLNTVTIESDDIYKAVDSSTDIWNQAGGLLVNATTVKVLKTIDDGSNTYLSSTGGFTLDKTSDPTYNIYTR